MNIIKVPKTWSNKPYCHTIGLKDGLYIFKDYLLLDIS